MAEVLAKTGIVERSGQGVDKIYFQSLAEAKAAPDYSETDNYQVTLRLSGVVQDKAFALFINSIQNGRKDREKLKVEEVIALDKIRRGIDKAEITSNILKKLLEEGLVEKEGKTKRQFYRLSKHYYSFTDQEHKYSSDSLLNDNEIYVIVKKHLEAFKTTKMEGFVKLFEKYNLTREQVKATIYRLEKSGAIIKMGKGSATKYSLSKITTNNKLIQRAVQLGIREMHKLGEISSDIIEEARLMVQNELGRDREENENENNKINVE